MRCIVLALATLSAVCLAESARGESPQAAACLQRAQTSADPPGDAVVNAVAGKPQADGEIVRLYWADNGDLTDRAHLHVFDCVVDGVRVVRAGPVNAEEVVLPIVDGDVAVPVEEIQSPR